ncbi:MAG: hypothetical protein AVO38_04940 [delta proteobacterium ML8_D]|nr:MAG: hypothetical protein AVO38_04940 [delta proteobacterium ML8_D]
MTGNRLSRSGLRRHHQARHTDSIGYPEFIQVVFLLMPDFSMAFEVWFVKFINDVKLRGG